jgi:DNA-binding beta-propeller fold protein YncE
MPGSDFSLGRLCKPDPSSSHAFQLVQFVIAFSESSIVQDLMALKSCLLVMDGGRVFRFDAQSGAFIDEFAGRQGPIGLLWSMAMGPRDLYVSSLEMYTQPVDRNGVARFSGRDGHLMDTFTLFSYRQSPIALGPDGNLYVGEVTGLGNASPGPTPIWRYNADTGAFIDFFVPEGSGGLAGTFDLIFGPDNHLYVSTPIGPQNRGGRNILRYDGTSGAFLGEFVAADSGGLVYPGAMAFGPDGNLYVADFSNKGVFRYDGTTGAFIDQFVSNTTGELKDPRGLAFGPDGHLFVSSYNSTGNDNVFRYDGTTGALLGALMPPRNRVDTIYDLLIAPMDVRLRAVPLPWRRVPRWLQVIMPIALGIVIGIVVANFARISRSQQNLRSRLNQRFR